MKNQEDGPEDAQLRLLLQRVKDLTEENRRLRKALASYHRLEAAPGATKASQSTSLTPQGKVKLFRDLFRGRDDAYAIRWVSRDGLRSGYSPARGRHGSGSSSDSNECLPLTDQVVANHLKGRHTIGLYPLLRDETCWLLAVDFDKASWMEDAAAFRTAAREAAVPVALERSRSGNGAHIWIFFTRPIRAALARQLGTGLLTRALESRYELGLDSYDRLFPSQDTLPKGGFGNLIALPLHGGSRSSGNTVFLDERFEAHKDQWDFLATFPRLDSDMVARIVDDLKTEEGLIPVRRLPMEEEAETQLHLPKTATPSDALGGKVTVRFANLILIPKGGLPPRATGELIRLASFQNPEFHRFEAMRLSTYGKPRIICCAENRPEHVALPRGCLESVSRWLAEAGSTLEIQDERCSGDPIDIGFLGRLTSPQESAVRAIVGADNGVLCAPPGFGKTVVAASVIAARGVNTLVLVHRRQLLDQWRARLEAFLGGSVEIGQVGGGKTAPTGQVDLAMLQSLGRMADDGELIGKYGQIIVDECHHIPAFTFEKTVRQAKARFVLGLTATPTRRDGHHPIIFMQCGPIRFKVDRRAAGGPTLTQTVIPRLTAFRFPEGDDDTPIQAILAALADDPARNDLIFDDIVAAVHRGEKPLVLGERVAQLERLKHRLEKFCHGVVLLKGGLSQNKRKEALREIRESAGSERLILATGRCIGEGFDEPELDSLFLITPISWKGTLQQYAGRLQRESVGKKEIRIYDYVDLEVPVLKRMFERRRHGYRRLGFSLQPIE